MTLPSWSTPCNMSSVKNAVCTMPGSEVNDTATLTYSLGYAELAPMCRYTFEVGEMRLGRTHSGCETVSCTACT